MNREKQKQIRVSEARAIFNIWFRIFNFDCWFCWLTLGKVLYSLVVFLLFACFLFVFFYSAKCLEAAALKWLRLMSQPIWTRRERRPAESSRCCITKNKEGSLHVFVAVVCFSVSLIRQQPHKLHMDAPPPSWWICRGLFNCTETDRSRGPQDKNNNIMWTQLYLFFFETFPLLICW